MSSDRARAIIDALTADVRRQLVYLSLYPAKVVSQNADFTLEVRPDAAVLPGLSKVPLRHGLPGVRVLVPAGARLLIGFDEGDPSRPYAALWEADAPATELRLGSQDAVDFVALAAKVEAEITALRDYVAAHTHLVSTTGTAAAQSGTAAAPLEPPASVGSVAASKVKAE